MKKNLPTYLYKLTPTGIEAKARISVKYLHNKMREYEALKIEIAQLQTELISHEAEKHP